MYPRVGEQKQGVSMFILSGDSLQLKESVLKEDYCSQRRWSKPVRSEDADARFHDTNSLTASHTMCCRVCFWPRNNYDTCSKWRKLKIHIMSSNQRCSLRVMAHILIVSKSLQAHQGYEISLYHHLFSLSQVIHKPHSSSVLLRMTI